MARYIDAEKIPYIDLNDDMPQSKIRVYIAFKERIDQIPSADVRENVRGEWEQVVSGWAIFMRCNQCKNAILENDFFEICRKVNYGSKLLDFCPNCGADMRGEQDG